MPARQSFNAPFADGVKIVFTSKVINLLPDQMFSRRDAENFSGQIITEYNIPILVNDDCFGQHLDKGFEGWLIAG